MPLRRESEKFMRKLMVVAVSVLLILAIGACTVFAAEYFKEKKNENNLNMLMEVFSSTISEYADADIIETKSVYGKLNGNGNGIQYFGSVLIRKDSIKDVVSLVEKLDLQFEIVEYCVQDECDISSKYLEHKTLKYDSPIDADSEYISIIFFNSKHPNSDFLDEAGH